MHFIFSQMSLIAVCSFWMVLIWQNMVVLCMNLCNVRCQKMLSCIKKFVSLCNWKSSVTSVQGKENDYDDAVCLHTCVDEMLFNIWILEDLYEKVLHKLVSVLTKHFTRDAILALSVTKKMEHRKQIKVSDTNKICVNNLNFSSIQTDLSQQNCSTLHVKSSSNPRKTNVAELYCKAVVSFVKPTTAKQRGRKTV